jgi:hypothetical protein
MQRHPLVDLGGRLGGVEDAAELAGGQVVDRVLARKQPAALQHHALIATGPPLGAKQIEQGSRQHGITVLPAFALLDPDQAHRHRCLGAQAVGRALALSGNGARSERRRSEVLTAKDGRNRATRSTDPG